MQSPLDNWAGIHTIKIDSLDKAHLILSIANQLNKDGILTHPKMAWIKKHLEDATTIIKKSLDAMPILSAHSN